MYEKTNSSQVVALDIQLRKKDCLATVRPTVRVDNPPPHTISLAVKYSNFIYNPPLGKVKKNGNLKWHLP